MHGTRGVWMGVLAAGMLAGAANAAEVEVAADLASAYLFRGITLNDGPVLQPSLEIGALKLGETELPLTLGVWANGDISDNDGALEKWAFSEVDLLLTLALPSFHEKLGFSLGYAEYLYPGQVTAVEPESGDLPQSLPADREISLACEIDCALLKPALTVNYGLDGAVQESLYADFGLGHDFALPGEVTLTLEAKVGYALPETGANGFNDLQLGASLGWKALTATVHYVAALDDEVLADVADGGGYDVKVVGILGISQSF